MLGFRLEFHWSLFLMAQLTIIQHWFRWAITWTNDDPIHWHIYASVRGGGGGVNCKHIFVGALEGPMQTLVGTVKSCENVALWDCYIRSLLIMLHHLKWNFYADTLKKKQLFKTSVVGIGIFHWGEMDNYMVADTIAPRSASSSVAVVYWLNRINVLFIAETCHYAYT